MSTTPKKTRKHAEIVKAWADGADVQWRDGIKEEWQDIPAGENPYFDPDVEYRIKPEPAAPVYPETNMSDQDICDAVPSLDGHKWNPQQVATPVFDGFRKMGNAAIRRAIDDGQVVVPGSVVNAEFDPDFQEVKAGENYRWMGHTAREWQEQYASMSKLAENRGTSLAEHIRKLAHAERVLKANGFTCSPDEGWSIHSANVSDDVRDAVASVGEYKERAASAELLAKVHSMKAEELQRQLREVEDKADLNLFGARVGRAVGDFLGMDREQLTHEQIAAIVLLEKAK